MRNLNWNDKKLRRKGHKMADTINTLSHDCTIEDYTISTFAQKKEIVHLPGYPE